MAHNCLPAQAFHTLYHSDESVLLGAPTGSGKTISAELAMLRAFRAHPGGKVIYIAPLKVPRLPWLDVWQRPPIRRLDAFLRCKARSVVSCCEARQEASSQEACFSHNTKPCAAALHIPSSVGLPLLCPAQGKSQPR